MKRSGLKSLLFLSVMAAIVVLSGLLPAAAEESKPADAAAPPTGDDIMAKVRANEYSESAEAVIQMALVDKNGKKQMRRFKIERLGENVLIRFLEPADIKDTGYLIVKDETGKTRVYYYFPPPTDDYREISLDDKDGGGAAFLGSDFDITDFKIRNPQDSANNYLRTESIPTKAAPIECYVVESIPKDPDYKYGKVVTWIRTDYWLPIKAEFYDRSGKLVKEMRVFSYKSVKDKTGEKRIISKSEMRDKQTEHASILEVETIQFDVPFPEDTFTIRNLTEP